MIIIIKREVNWKFRSYSVIT